MQISDFFKSIIDSDDTPVVICNLEHEIIYINPSAAERYSKWGGHSLLGKSLLKCHNKESADKINQVLEWFNTNKSNNKVYTFYNKSENKDVYMVALRDDDGELIGYYEKHEFRNRETCQLYELN